MTTAVFTTNVKTAATIATSRKKIAAVSSIVPSPMHDAYPLPDMQVRRLEAVDGCRDVASLHGEVVVFRAVDRAEEKRAVLEAALYHFDVAEGLRLAVGVGGVDRHDVRHAVGNVVEEAKGFRRP